MANHTLKTLDSGRHLRITGTDSSVNLLLFVTANDTNLPWPRGTYFEIYNGLDNGPVVIQPQTGVTINQASGTLTIPDQGLARLYLTDSTTPSNLWDMFIVQTTAGAGFTWLDVSFDYTITLSDAGNGLSVNDSSNGPVNIFVPLNADEPFPIGTKILVVNDGVQTVTLIPDVGVQIRSRLGDLILAGQYAVVTLIKYTADVWYAYGDF